MGWRDGSTGVMPDPGHALQSVIDAPFADT
jgi:hypothetical protein